MNKDKILREKINILYKYFYPKHFLNIKTISIVEVKKEIENIKSINNFYSIPILSYFMVNKSDKLINDIANAISFYVDKLDSKSLINLANRFRETGFYYYYFENDYIKQDLDNFKNLKIDEIYMANILKVMTLNRNGYIREYALEKIYNTFEKVSLPYILLRLNDWVKVIKDKAKNYIYNIYEKFSETIFIDYIYLLNYVYENADTEIKSFLEIILKKLKNKKYLYNFLNLIYSKDLFLARASYKFLIGFIVKDKENVYNQGVFHKDSIINRYALNHSKTIINENNIQHYVCLFQKLKKIDFRKQILYIIDELKFYKIDLLKLFILDSSKSVRDLSNYIIKKNELDINPNDIYSEIIKSKNQKYLSVAILGLSEISKNFDYNMYLSIFNETKDNNLKKSILIAISKIKNPEIHSFIIDNLFSKNESLSSISAKIIKKSVFDFDLDIILNKYDKNLSLIISNRVIKIINELNKWNCLYYLLKILKFGINLELIFQSIKNIRINSSYMKPDNNKLQEIIKNSKSLLSVNKEVYNYVKEYFLKDLI